MSFERWVRQHFLTTPIDEGKPVSEVKQAAIAQCGISERWWNDRSGLFLEKRNVDGIWHCRPKGTNG
jgi:hypothetical protein